MSLIRNYQPKSNNTHHKRQHANQYQDIRNEKIAIYKHTKEYCETMKFPTQPSIKYEFRHFSKMQIGQITSINIPRINVENIDSFGMAYQMMKNGKLHIVVLNFMSPFTPGGGVERGCSAQEEDLFRQSNYFENIDKKLYEPHGLEFDKGIYTPEVRVVKDNQSNLLEKSFVVSCLAVAALHKPKLNTDGTYKRFVDEKMMQKKIDMIFKVAYKHNHKNLVLGALGCGVFENPPEIISKMFKKSIEKYGHHFEEIGFAVLSKGPNKNYDIFNQEFSV